MFMVSQCPSSATGLCRERVTRLRSDIVGAVSQRQSGESVGLSPPVTLYTEYTDTDPTRQPAGDGRPEQEPNP